MLLAIDIGNTNIVIGGIDRNKIYFIERLSTVRTKTELEYAVDIKTVLDIYGITDNDIDGCIISSVVPIITSAIKNVFVKHYNIKPIILGPGVKTGVSLKVDDPKTVGADIICDVAGIYGLEDEAIIIDLGTATKYIYAKNQVFYGVSIAPGVMISMKALVNNAALLPNVEFVQPKKVIGTSTINCIQSGVIYGAASQVDGMIERIKEEINNPNVKVFATG